MGSPLYEALLQVAAVDVEARGPAWRILRRHVAPGRGGALGLRFMAAVHRLVLSGRAPGLAGHYPSAGGDGDAVAARKAFHRLLEGEVETLSELTALPCQTNEVGRAAALIWALLDAAATFGLPLRLLEVGASAGLNLRLDHFRYGGGGANLGLEDSPVNLEGLWHDAPLRTDVALRVASRQGCDPSPLDPSKDEDRLALRASIWADQLARFQRLDGALALAARVPAAVDRASVVDWLPSRLAAAAENSTRVVFHSIVDEYLDPATRTVFHAALERSGEQATERSPLAWVRLEAVTDLREHGLFVTLWPGGKTRLLARCGAHGTRVRRAT